MIYICSANDFQCQQMTFITYSTNDFYIKKMTFAFNKEFAYSAIWNLPSVTWDLYSTIWDLRLTKWNLFNQNHLHSANKFRCNKIYNIPPKAFGRTKDLVCKLYIQFVTIFSHFSTVYCTLHRWSLRAKFCFFLLSFGQWTYVRNWDGVGVWSHACGRPQVFCMNITMTCVYSSKWGLQQNVLLA